MKPVEFRKLCSGLWGWGWQSKMARDPDIEKVRGKPISRRTIVRMAAGETVIRSDIADWLRAKVKRKGKP